MTCSRVSWRVRRWRAISSCTKISPRLTLSMPCGCTAGYAATGNCCHGWGGRFRQPQAKRRKALCRMSTAGKSSIICAEASFRHRCCCFLLQAGLCCRAVRRSGRCWRLQCRAVICLARCTACCLADCGAGSLGMQSTGLPNGAGDGSWPSLFWSAIQSFRWMLSPGRSGGFRFQSRNCWNGPLPRINPRLCANMVSGRSHGA